MTEPPRFRVLCVDDEPGILEGLTLHLRRRYAVSTVTSAEQGLELIRAAGGEFAVVISDMRMPGMDGASFLAQVRELAPHTVRVMLTGHSEMSAVAAAVNEGRIFRFLLKPTPPDVLMTTVAAAVEQHQLLTAERVLLEQTLQGCIQALTDLLSLSNPALFRRALRLKLQVSELAMKLELRNRWQVEVAAMLSQAACVALPAETLERVICGQRLSDEESRMVARLPEQTEQMLANIPRLEGVRAILGAYGRRYLGASSANVDLDRADPIERAAMILRIAADIDTLDLRGIDAALGLNMLRASRGCYDPQVLDALASVRGVTCAALNTHELPLDAVRPGMVIAEDVRTDKGTLLVGRGYQVTDGFVERTRSYPGMQARTIRVFISPAAGLSAAVEAAPPAALTL